MPRTKKLLLPNLKASSLNETLNYNMSASGVYYPRPRRNYSELLDCGCPYSCSDVELDSTQPLMKQSCRQAAHCKMYEKSRMHGWYGYMGEEMACHKSPECSDKCNFMTCKKPTLKDVKFEPPTSFIRNEGVVIASKIMGWPAEIDTVKQMLCLLTSAYNERMNYDIVVFSTLDQDNKTIREIQSIVEPAKFTLVHENVTVGGLIDSMTPARRKFFLDNCIENHTHQFTWNSGCPNIGSIRYNWQAEFRSLHIWTQPELAPYKYMLWIDSDSFQTMRWDKDPVDFVIRNDLVLAALNLQGKGGGAGLQAKIKDYFGHHLCSVIVDQNSSIYAKIDVEGCGGNRFDIVHGFFHIENLDFFRSNMKWMTKFIGEDRLSRNPDDQEAVTTAALLLAPGRTRDLHFSGIKLNMMHNGLIDGKRQITPAQYLKWWQYFSERDFPNGREKCSKYIVAGGR
eukprot:CAMPEP_0197717200 /NCGR_PEP_ID=MMETSP1434-20131217/1818_1 /TAXON_ID=265543 /ORGANISM="Minutocellus polymorphus, Strain CCMP3303" /LENGTH=453 /DNA_ID=CAMNT_0043301695 /DNA_START=216 /DNA_END=1577 /DNA_ORIENTATION=+